MAEATRFNKWSDSSWVAFNIYVPRGFDTERATDYLQVGHVQLR